MNWVEIEVERYTDTECICYDEDWSDFGDLGSALLSGAMSADDAARVIRDAVIAREALDTSLADEDRTVDVAVLVTITMTGQTPSLSEMDA